MKKPPLGEIKVPAQVTWLATENLTPGSTLSPEVGDCFSPALMLQGKLREPEWLVQAAQLPLEVMKHEPNPLPLILLSRMKCKPRDLMGT